MCLDKFLENSWSAHTSNAHSIWHQADRAVQVELELKFVISSIKCVTLTWWTILGTDYKRQLEATIDLLYVSTFVV